MLTCYVYPDKDTGPILDLVSSMCQSKYSICVLIYVCMCVYMCNLCVLTLYLYNCYCCLQVNTTSPYGLTGSIFSRDRAYVERVMKELRQSAGNFYINDKSTGSVVGQQPFGGARLSG